MKVTILYEQKKYVCEMKQTFLTEDIIFNMRKILGDKETQEYILCDINGKNIENFHFFSHTSKKELTLILMNKPKFNPEESLFNDKIKEDIINVTSGGLSSYEINQKFPINHGNPLKKREPTFEMIGNIYGNFNDLPDLEVETSRK